MQSLEVIILLLFIVSFLALATYRQRFPFPVVLVLAGIAISLVPGIPSISLKPEIVFLIFLPPLLYAAAWNISWRDFKANIRPISLASIGLIFFTTTCIGVLVHSLIPGASWAMSFLLGAIVSPPDAVAAASITRGLGLHPRIIAILEGESLLNDASALIAYKYALASVLAGTFSMTEASLDFLRLFFGGAACGLLLGYIFYRVHTSWQKEASLDVTLTLLVPFTAYLLAERLHFSGVLAVVSAGLYLSFRSAEIFSNKARIQVYAVWEVIVFVLNALVFILMGLQLRSISIGFKHGEIIRLIIYGVGLGAAALLIRFLWIIPASLLPRWISKKVRETEVYDKRYITVFSFAGIRGIVSLAAALSLPMTTPSGEELPLRSEWLFLTFVFIVFTILFQGLSITWIVKKLQLPKYSILAEEYTVREELINKIRSHVQSDQFEVGDQARQMLLSNYKVRYHLLQQTHLPKLKRSKEASKANTIFNEFAEAQLNLLELERSLANDLRKSGKASEEVLRKIEREIDLEEARLQLELYND
jgi:Na+/H+ antiporter